MIRSARERRTLVKNLDPESLDLFARKGREGGPDVPQAGAANAVKVRRVMQVTADLAGAPFEELEILDLGCGEGVYAIEAALHGATVRAIDVRHERLDQGRAVAERHGLDRLTFEVADLRRIDPAAATYDVVFALGILYHFDAPEVFDVLARLRGLARRFVVIDTFLTTQPTVALDHAGWTYDAERVREHEDDDPPDVRRARLLRSIDSTHAVRFTHRSLVDALAHAGFTSAGECFVPFEPGKPDDRRTFVAFAGQPMTLATYPWINGMTDAELAGRLDRDA